MPQDLDVDDPANPPPISISVDLSNLSSDSRRPGSLNSPMVSVASEELNAAEVSGAESLGQMSEAEEGLLANKWWDKTPPFISQEVVVPNRLNQEVCYVCRARGELLECAGPCCRSFHLPCCGAAAGTAATKAAVNWLCDECVMLHDALQLRGLSFIYRLVEDPKNFADFGADMMHTFHDLSLVTKEPLRQFALDRLEALAQRWKMRYQKLSDIQRGSRVSASDVMDAVMGIHALERIGITHSLKAETRKFVQQSDYMGLHDYLGLTEGDGEGGAGPCALAWAVTAAYFADGARVDLGATKAQLDVLPRLTEVRPYRLAVDMEFEAWADQMGLVFAVIHIASNFGELRLSPKLLPMEAYVIMHPSSMEVALKEGDVHILGQLGHCMRILGAKPGDAALERAAAALLRLQRLDGSWPARDDARPYSRFHAAAAAAAALAPPTFRGFGPGDPAVAALLQTLQPHAGIGATAGALQVDGGGGGRGGGGRASANSGSSGGGSMSSGGGGACGAPARTQLCGCGILIAPEMGGLSAVAAEYVGSSHGHGGDLHLGLRERARRRLRALVRWRQQQEAAAAAAAVGGFGGDGSGGGGGAGGGGGVARRSDPGRWGRLSRRAARKGLE
ncbi:hypothetical protein JKP88DRAFT_346747 [Tribonema minus]|uniref:PHD-type domain-containing protein n=1 Tax=Tribonema minus TaxID=303371 RepID=A0A835YTP3_9STRA|nr:hypothetical protein JKP88DRAFT_346747 [Tribonema minus]